MAMVLQIAEILIPFAWLALLLAVIRKAAIFRLDAVKSAEVQLLFVLKSVAGIAVWKWYEHIYGNSDMMGYFMEAQKVYHSGLLNFIEALISGDKDLLLRLGDWTLVHSDASFNSSRIMYLLHLLMMPFSFGNVYVNNILFSFMSFIGIVFFYKTFSRHLALKRFFFYALCLFPSLLFFTSGGSKEALAMAGMGLFLYAMQGILSAGKKITFLMTGGLLLLMVKPILFILVTAVFLPSVIKIKGMIWHAMASSLILAVSMMVLQYTGYKNVLQVMHIHYRHEMSYTRGGVFLLNNNNYIRINEEEGEHHLVAAGQDLYRIKDGTRLMLWKIGGSMEDTTFVESSTDTAQYRIFRVIKKTETTVPLLTIDGTLSGFVRQAPQAFYNAAIGLSSANVMRPSLLLLLLEFLTLLVPALANVLFFNRTNRLLLLCMAAAASYLLFIGYTTIAFGAIVRHRSLLIPLLLFVAINDSKMAGKISGFFSYLRASFR